MGLDQGKARVHAQAVGLPEVQDLEQEKSENLPRIEPDDEDGLQQLHKAQGVQRKIAKKILCNNAGFYNSASENKTIWRHTRRKRKTLL